MSDTHEESRETVASSTVNSVRGKVGGFTSLPSVKLFLIGFIGFLLLIPSTFVWVLVEERADRARDVARDIAQSWGGTQTINGPYLIVPFIETKIIGEGRKQEEKIWRRTAVLFPETLDFTGDVAVEERKRSIYTLPVYKLNAKLAGKFSAPPQGTFDAVNGGTIQIEGDKAALVVGVGDVRALKNEVFLKFAGRTVPFEPGLYGMTSEDRMAYKHPSLNLGSSGMGVPIPQENWQRGFAFALDLKLNGSSALYVAPAGQTTKLALASDWPHPGFTGTYLPDTREISDKGFSADWSIPYLARGLPKVVETSSLPLTDRLMGVEFVEPVNFYQTISRSLKYAVGFIGLTFMAVFLLEMRSGWSMHWIQYGLTGMALIVFYVMLLAFSEHIGYAKAYVVAAAAATGLIAAYVGTTLKSKMAAGIMVLVIGAVYGVLYAIMREQDYALLIGSVIAFIALGVTMFGTNRVDWAGGRKAPQGVPA